MLAVSKQEGRLAKRWTHRRKLGSFAAVSSDAEDLCASMDCSSHSRTRKQALTGSRDGRSVSVKIVALLGLVYCATTLFGMRYDNLVPAQRKTTALDSEMVRKKTVRNRNKRNEVFSAPLPANNTSYFIEYNKGLSSPSDERKTLHHATIRGQSGIPQWHASSAPNRPRRSDIFRGSKDSPNVPDGQA